LALHRFVLRFGPSGLLATGLTAVCLLPLAMLFSERPWLFTILFGTLTLHAVLDVREGRRTLLPWLLPVLFVVWANVHIQFVYGLALLVLACVSPVIDRWRRAGDETTPAAFGSHGWLKMVALTVACVLATFLNPYHARLYGVVVEYALQPGPFQFVNELKALEFREACDWAVLALTGAAAFVLGRKTRLCSFEILLFIGCAILSFRARRDVWLVVLASAMVLSESLRSSIPVTTSDRLTIRYRLALGIALVALAGLLTWTRGLTPAKLERTAAEVFPANAARFVAEHGYEGPLYNDFNWGGYLIRALPALPVAIDGRTNLHGDDRLVRFGSTWAGGPSWRDDPELCEAGVVIAERDTPLASLLACDARFRLVYEDTIARVFVARGDSASKVTQP
jgi:hypothetical protein